MLEYFKSNHTNISIHLQKRIGFIVEFARHGMITDSITMRDIITTVDSSSADTASSTIASSTTAGETQKKTVPTLESFTGYDEHYYTWRDSVINDLGSSGLGKFVIDDDAHLLYEELPISVLYALRKVLADVLANTEANKLFDAGDFNPRKLWIELVDYYDTEVNRANINVFEIRKLLSLTLDESSTPLKFVSEMRACLLRLKRNKAQLHKDNDTLRAFLLVAIQDVDFDKIRDTIIDQPTKSIDDLLNDICTKDASLQLKDGVRSLHGDGTSTVTRRVSSNKTGSKNRVQDDIKNGRWVILTFPPGWSKAIGPKLFKILSEWRKAAIFQHSLQKTLDKTFALRVDNVAKQNKKNARFARKADINMED